MIAQDLHDASRFRCTSARRHRERITFAARRIRRPSLRFKETVVGRSGGPHRGSLFFVECASDVPRPQW
jgi:hypothetical protein